MLEIFANHLQENMHAKLVQSVSRTTKCSKQCHLATMTQYQEGGKYSYTTIFVPKFTNLQEHIYLPEDWGVDRM